MSNVLNHLASMPGLAHTTVERKELKQILLDTDGQLMACGRLWDIESRHLGAGVYRIKLKERL